MLLEREVATPQRQLSLPSVNAKNGASKKTE